MAISLVKAPNRQGGANRIVNDVILDDNVGCSALVPYLPLIISAIPSGDLL
jgi:hypothetical protein